jgi:hypothetical protein
LTDVNTVTQNPGKIGNAAQFTRANSEQLTIASNAALTMGDIDFTLAGWVYLDTLVVAGIVSKALALEYTLLTLGNRFQFSVTNSLPAQIDVIANNFGQPALATWHFVACWHDSVANLIGISVNGGTANTTANALGVAAGAAGFQLGNYAANFWDGRIDEFGVWKRVLTPAELTTLYNGGAGVNLFAGGGAVSKFSNRIRIGIG